MKIKNNSVFSVLLIAVLFFINGCSKYKESRNDADMDKQSVGSISNEKLTAPESESKYITSNERQEDKLKTFMSRLIIRSGTISIETNNFDESVKKISGSALSFQGVISNTSSEMNAGGKKQGSVSVRIPSDKFDAFISEINETGRVISQNISGNDVTEEYIDLDARQKTQKELERRLLELLSQKTAGLSDVVEVEQKLSGVRENIEKTEGRMNFLKDQSAFSTLTINLFEPSMLQTSSGGGFFYEIEEGFKNGLEGFTEILSSLITFVIAFSPVILFLLIFTYLLKKYFTNKKIKGLINKTF